MEKKVHKNQSKLPESTNIWGNLASWTNSPTYTGLQPQKVHPRVHTDGPSHPEKGKLTSILFVSEERSESLGLETLDKAGLNYPKN